MARKPTEMTVSRADILMAAAEVLQQRGYSGTTMKEIAAAVNLTAASLYYHFHNKDALILAALEYGLAEGTRRVEALACSADQSATQRLNAMIRAHIIGLTERPAIGAAMVFEIHSLAHASPPKKYASDSEREAYASFIARRDAFFALRDRFEELFRQVVNEGIRAGEFREQDAAITAKTLLGAQNWVGVWYRPDGRLSGEQIAERMANVLMEGIVKEVINDG